jgi:hypothetical protein
VINKFILAMKCLCTVASTAIDITMKGALGGEMDAIMASEIAVAFEGFGAAVAGVRLGLLSKSGRMRDRWGLSDRG